MGGRPSRTDGVAPAVSRLWEDEGRGPTFEWAPQPDDLDLRDVGQAIPIRVRSSDSGVVLTIVVDTYADVVELTLSHRAARRVTAALILATRSELAEQRPTLPEGPRTTRSPR